MDDGDEQWKFVVERDAEIGCLIEECHDDVNVKLMFDDIELDRRQTLEHYGIPTGAVLKKIKNSQDNIDRNRTLAYRIEID